MARIDGVISADLNFASATLLVEYDPDAQPLEAVVRVVEGTGHGIARLDETGSATPAPERPWLDRHLAEVATVGSGVFSVVGAVLAWADMPETAAIAAYAVAIAFGGLLVWRRAMVSLKARILDMNVLMSVAVFGAAALGEWGEGATVFFLFALGGLLESRSLERTRRSIRDLMDLAPEVARVNRGPAWVETPVAEVHVGETLQVRPGERIPLDGVVDAGSSAVDESPITGESAPAEKITGDRVFAGTLNVTGLLDIVVTSATAESTLARIVNLVEEAQAARAPSQRFVDRFSRVYTPAVIVLALAVAVVPPVIGMLAGVEDVLWSEWIRRALVVLVVSCPCALVISTPVSIVSGITRASRDGVLVKGGAFLEIAARVRAVAFDKTGTLTTGRPELQRIVVPGGLDAQRALAVAAALEAHSNHPVARALVRAAEDDAIAIAPVKGFRETHGRGVRGEVEGVVWEVCSPMCAAESAAMTGEAEATVDEMEQRGMTVLVMLGDGVVEAIFGVADEVRPEASEALATLRRTGIDHLVMLTGDNERVASAVAVQAGLTEFLFGLLPEAKTEAVAGLHERYGTVAMVGDGVNDAPALARSDIGIAMGAVGTDAALETADVALMRDDLRMLADFFALGRRTVRTIRQNVVFSIAVKAVFLVLALTGKATLWMAVFADTGVSLLVILNGMRLLRRRA